MKPKEIDFEVILGSAPTSLEDWKRAQEAKPSELPPLNEAQKAVAGKLGLTEEQYKRSYLSLLYGQERMRSRTADLGNVVEEILLDTSPNYRLLAIIARMDQGHWIVEIQCSKQIVSVAIPRELGDDLLDSGRTEYRDALQRMLLSNLKHEKMSAKNIANL